MASARSGDPAARSSITRSSSETGNVTPTALMAWRSMGDSSHGRDGSRVARGVLARTPSRRPDGLAASARPPRPGLGASHRSRTVGLAAVMSTSSLAPDGDDGRSSDIGAPDSPHEGRLDGIDRQRRGDGHGAGGVHAVGWWPVGSGAWNPDGSAPCAASRRMTKP